ncbi:hypothetical protein OESDEN_13039 [Oesophagostomum dentatum]|uniref:Uncharacterized protein n=1 Tax=Oesophagostomum dentatum TaxID=61180 RepID=A0A0B1SUL2_OESDE|nr:hypothetical protein OESDEN_13039 [Oesophagostomum dentatum]
MRSAGTIALFFLLTWSFGSCYVFKKSYYYPKSYNYYYPEAYNYYPEEFDNFYVKANYYAPEKKPTGFDCKNNIARACKKILRRPRGFCDKLLRQLRKEEDLMDMLVQQHDNIARACKKILRRPRGFCDKLLRQLRKEEDLMDMLVQQHDNRYRPEHDDVMDQTVEIGKKKLCAKVCRK